MTESVMARVWVNDSLYQFVNAKTQIGQWAGSAAGRQHIKFIICFSG